MKKLILMRHAKAKSNDRMEIPDIERDLEDKGIKDSKLMGKYLNKEKLIPDKIICSHSNRTKQTLEGLLKELNTGIRVELSELIYQNDGNKILKLISKENDEIKCLMILGHNPSMEDLASLLTGESFPMDKFSTAGAAVIEFDTVHWNQIKANAGKLKLFKSPKMLQ